MNEFDYKKEYKNVFKIIYSLYFKKKLLLGLNSKNSSMKDRINIYREYEYEKKKLLFNLFNYVNDISNNNNMVDILYEN